MIIGTDMPKIKLAQMRAAFFANPQKVSAAVWAASMFSLLIPTCLKLVPLGNKDKSAKGDRDRAQDDYDTTLQKLNGINDQIREARQRVLDLDCAMAGYQGYNNGVVTFSQSIIDSGATPMDRLRLFWNLQFAADRSENSQNVLVKTWSEDVFEYDYYYSCIWHSCGKGKSCCFDWGWRWVTYTHQYNEITIIANIYKNIVQGPGLRLTSLNCGYYSRDFQNQVPETYVTYESPQVVSGDRRAGSVYINFERDFGSRVPMDYVLDANTIRTPAIVARSATQGDAATNLAASLYQFLGAAIAAFNVTGANYPALQNSIRNSIPLLLEQASSVNATLQEKALVLAEEQVLFSRADDDFHEGLSLWLPLFFLIPGGLALLAYVIASRCGNWCALEENHQNDMESGQVTTNVPAETCPPVLELESAPESEVEAPPPYSLN